MHMKSIPIILVLAVTGMTSCKDAGTSPSPDEVFDQIRIAVFRYQIPTQDSTIDRARACYLGLLVLDSLGHYYVDPSDHVMIAFQTNQRVSECIISLEGVFDKRTGNLGAFYFVGSITQTQPDTYEVQGGWYRSGNGAEGYRFTVIGVPYHWTVIKSVLTWMS